MIRFLEDKFDGNTIILNKWFIKLILREKSESITLHFPFIVFVNWVPKNLLSGFKTNKFPREYFNKTCGGDKLSWKNIVRFDNSTQRIFPLDNELVISTLKSFYKLIFQNITPTIVSNDYNVMDAYDYKIFIHSSNIESSHIPKWTISLGYESYINDKRVTNLDIYNICFSFSVFFKIEFIWFDIIQFLTEVKNLEEKAYFLNEKPINGKKLREFFSSLYTVDSNIKKEEILIINSIFKRKTTIDIIECFSDPYQSNVHNYKGGVRFPKINILNKINLIDDGTDDVELKDKEEEETIRIYGFNVKIPFFIDDHQKNEIENNSISLFNFICQVDINIRNLFPVELIFFLSMKFQNDKLIFSNFNRFNVLYTKFMELSNKTKKIILKYNIVKIVDEIHSKNRKTREKIENFVKEVLEKDIFFFINFNLFFEFGVNTLYSKQLILHAINTKYKNFKIQNFTENETTKFKEEMNKFFSKN